MSDILDDDDIPAFLKNKSPESIIDEIEAADDDDFDFPSLDDDEVDIGNVIDEEDPPIETLIAPEEPKPAPKPKAKPKAKDKAPSTITEVIEKAEEIAAENPRARPGSNSGVDGTALRGFIERIERLEESKKEISDDIKDVKAEAKGTGYDVKAINRILKKRKQDKAERDEQEALDHLYMFALGME